MWHCLGRLFLFALVLLFCLRSASAESLRITSTPAGASVELDGVLVGTTPFEKDLPGGYFHRTHTVVGQRLEHPMIARVSLPGYATREIALTEGPMNWIDLHGRSHGQYWLLKATQFHVDLDLVASTFTGNISPAAPATPASIQLELSLEELVRRTKPAVVYLKALESSGSGFFVTETGLIATNAHVARGSTSLLALLPNGLQLEAKVVYIDAELDIALLKIDPPSPDFVFPHVSLAEAASVRQGESVLAIGNPGDAMLFSVTKGIVSAVGKFTAAGPGTWIQTDAPINPGNSGGPLVNSRGEVIGLNTQKLVKKNVNGIGFALSASDLLAVLHRFYPAAVSDVQRLSAPAKMRAANADANPAAFGTVVFDEPSGAEIYVDQRFVGQVPSTLSLPTGTHLISVRKNGAADWSRNVEVLAGSSITLRASF